MATPDQCPHLKRLEEISAGLRKSTAQLASQPPRKKLKDSHKHVLNAMDQVGSIGTGIIAILTLGFLVGKDISRGKRD